MAKQCAQLREKVFFLKATHEQTPIIHENKYPLNAAENIVIFLLDRGLRKRYEPQESKTKTSVSVMGKNQNRQMFKKTALRKKKKEQYKTIRKYER